MSNGACVIASKVGGITEILGNNGMLIENIDYLKLQKNLIEVLNNKKLREDYQKKSWNNFMFLQKIQVRDWINLEREILEEHF